MKTITLLSTFLFALVLIGCDYPDADFKNQSYGLIVNKSQNADEKSNGAAEYTIHTMSLKGYREYRTIILVLSEDFGNANDTIQFTNGVMFAAPKRVNAEKP